MKISQVEVLELIGEFKGGKDFWEERSIRPIDVYPEYGREEVIRWKLRESQNERFELSHIYVRILTDDGLSGVCGPIGAPIGDIEAYIISRRLKKILVGKDPFQIELIWDQMYRLLVHGRKGYGIMAVSAVDCALWDLIGKALNKPVFKLLGGPTREKVRVYASTLGFSLRSDLVEERCKQFIDEGYTAMKWFVRFGPSDGVKGVEENLKLVKTIRDVVGYEVDLMIDCWMSWNVRYAFKMAKEFDKYEVKWIEEPLMPDNIDGYSELRSMIRKAGLNILVAGGEHEYTRWGFKQLIDKGALDILQPDIVWAGGLTETLKICALASSNDLQVIPHTGVVSTTLNLLLSQPETLCPIAEYLIKWNIINQAFHKEQIVPRKGHLLIPDKPGLGIEIDWSKVREIKRIV